MISSEVSKGTNESSASTLRRFSRKVRELGTIKLVRKGRYRTRPLSPLKRKEQALKKIAKREHINKLKKLGKMQDGFNK